MRIAHDARIAPFLDVAGAAAHFHRIARHAPRIAARAELDQRRQDPHAARGLLVAGFSLRQQQCDLHEHRARGLGRQQHLQQLALHQRHLDQLAAKGLAMRGNVQRFVQRAPHQPCRTHAVRQPRQVDHVGHLVKAAADLADQVSLRAFERDLAARHRAAAELVLQAHDPVAVARAVRQRLRQQEQCEALDAVRRAVGAREHHREIGVRVRAEPFVAMQAPGRLAVRVRLARRACRDAADVGSGRLLGHEHRPLVQRVEIARREHRQVARDQRRIAVAAQRVRQRIGHADRAAQPEFGLHEQERQRVLDERRHGIRLVAQRREPEFRIRDALERDVGRILVDPLHGLAAPVAVLEHRRMLVRARRPFVELARHARAERAQLRFEFGVTRVAQVQLQERAEIGIDGEEVDAPAVGDVGCAGGRRAIGVVHACVSVAERAPCACPAPVFRGRSASACRHRPVPRQSFGRA